MTYDLYSYRHSTKTPSTEEAISVISSEEDSTFRDDKEAREIKEKIAGLILELNPKLERFQIDYEQVCKTQDISMEEARARLNHIELNPLDGDLAVQLTIYWDHVCLTFPYWYAGPQQEAVFELALGYLRAIRKAEGFFAYDPQTDVAFDPGELHFLDRSSYSRIINNLPQILAQGEAKQPWWKFW